jgi:ubiquitin carboxyl-terminal hydrolase L3
MKLLSLVPQPSKAFILCFPITDELNKAQADDNARIATEGQHPLDPTVVYIKQTVSAIVGILVINIRTLTSIPA